ncbi:head GIN domain-containing protein [Mucilaginibacter koreensis]
MKPALSLFALAIAATTLASSCKNTACIKGSGHQATDNRKVDNFNKLEVDGAFKVTLHQDSSFSVAITADDNLLKNIKTTVSGGKLHVFNKEGICNSGEMTLNIGVAKLEGIDLSGAVELASAGKLNVQDIRLNFAGSSHVTLDMNAANVTTEGAGSTELHLTGQATSHRMDLSGSSQVSAFDFVTGSYQIVSAGASNCQINVLKSLKVQSHGSSEVEYKGNPTEVESNKSEASSVTKVN